MHDMSDLRKSIAERLGSAAKSERPGAKAKFSMQFEVGKTYEHSFANDSDSRVMWKVMARSGSMLTIKQVASGYRVKTNDPSDYRHGVSAVNGETKRVKIHSDERGEYVYPMGRYSMAPSIRATDIARGFSRPGAKAKFMTNAGFAFLQKMLREYASMKGTRWYNEAEEIRDNSTEYTDADVIAAVGNLKAKSVSSRPGAKAKMALSEVLSFVNRALQNAPVGLLRDVMEESLLRYWNHTQAAKKMEQRGDLANATKHRAEAGRETRIYTELWYKMGKSALDLKAITDALNKMTASRPGAKGSSKAKA
jgi:hypothetical protein